MGDCNKYPITIKQGATFQKTLVWEDEDGNAIVLTGATAKMQVRSTPDSDTVLVELSTDNGRIVITPLTGTIALNIPAVVTELLDAPAEAVYDLEITDANSVVTRLLEGPVSITPEVTK